jgi:hypothetical protein
MHAVPDDILRFNAIAIPSPLPSCITFGNPFSVKPATTPDPFPLLPLARDLVVHSILPTRPLDSSLRATQPLPSTLAKSSYLASFVSVIFSCQILHDNVHASLRSLPLYCQHYCLLFADFCSCSSSAVLLQSAISRRSLLPIIFTSFITR